jgi:hypothetical protein
LEIHDQSEGEKGAFFIKLETSLPAEMVGVIALPKRQIIDPIGVIETLKGKGIGTKYAKAWSTLSERSHLRHSDLLFCKNTG